MVVGRTPDIDEVPGRALKEHIPGLIGNFGFESAHHASDGKRPRFITDEDIGALQLSFYVVEGGQFFTFLGCTRGDNYGLLR